MNPLFVKALSILEKIEAAGFEAYFVGGSVRDELLGRPISDVDIATSATPNEIKMIFPNTVDVGIEHGTVLVLYQGEGYEVTTFRSESEYKDFRRPDEVQFIRSLYEDLKRRDFTMNAIAMNRNGELIDPFQGRMAILQKRIETVGSASERFSEDALRMMRAIRFVSQLSFTLDSEVFNALTKMGHLLRHIAVERKSAEFEKILAGKNRKQAFLFLSQTNLEQYLPGLGQSAKSVKLASLYPCESLNVEEMWVLLLYLLEISNENTNKFLREWKLPVKKIREIQTIYSWLRFRESAPWNKLALYDAGTETIMPTERVLNVLNKRPVNTSVADLFDQYQALPIKTRSELVITGHDLMKLLNRARGPWLKDILRDIETEIVEGRLANQKERIREWVLSCNLR